MNRKKHPHLLPVDASGTNALEAAAPLRWESVMPRLIEGSDGGEELRRMGLAADEYAHRKYVAQALSQRDLTPLFEAFPGHPFLKPFAVLYQLADDEQRFALLEGVGLTLLEFAHWKGWLPHLAVPPNPLEMAGIVPNADAPNPATIPANTRETAPLDKAQSSVWDTSKRQKMSKDMKKRSKDLAAAHFGVKPAEFSTSAEFAEKAGVADWKLQEMQKDGHPFLSPVARAERVSIAVEQDRRFGVHAQTGAAKGQAVGRPRLNR